MLEMLTVVLSFHRDSCGALIEQQNWLCVRKINSCYNFELLNVTVQQLLCCPQLCVFLVGGDQWGSPGYVKCIPLPHRRAVGQVSDLCCYLNTTISLAFTTIYFKFFCYILFNLYNSSCVWSLLLKAAGVAMVMFQDFKNIVNIKKYP